MTSLAQITAPHFCAGLEITAGRCTIAAPILKWCVGKSEDEIRRYCQRKGWLWVLVNARPTTPRG